MTSVPGPNGDVELTPAAGETPSHEVLVSEAKPLSDAVAPAGESNNPAAKPLSGGVVPAGETPSNNSAAKPLNAGVAPAGETPSDNPAAKPLSGGVAPTGETPSDNPAAKLLSGGVAPAGETPTDNPAAKPLNAGVAPVGETPSDNPTAKPRSGGVAPVAPAGETPTDNPAAKPLSAGIALAGETSSNAKPLDEEVASAGETSRDKGVAQEIVEEEEVNRNNNQDSGGSNNSSAPGGSDNNSAPSGSNNNSAPGGRSNNSAPGGRNNQAGSNNQGAFCHTFIGSLTSFIRRSSLSSGGFRRPTQGLIGDDGQPAPWTLSMNVFLALAGMLITLAVTSFAAVPAGYVTPTSNTTAGSLPSDAGSSTLLHSTKQLANIKVFYGLTSSNVVISITLILSALKWSGGFKFSRWSTLFLSISAVIELGALYTLLMINLNLGKLAEVLGLVFFLLVFLVVFILFGFPVAAMYDAPSLDPEAGGNQG